MIDLDDIFSEKKQDNLSKLENGVSLVDDINIWSDKFYKHLLNVDISHNTLISYKSALNTLKEYCKIYKQDSGGLCDIDETCCNDYLLWMENYKTNKRYGSLKERIIHLSHFIKFMQEQNETDYIDGREHYFKTIKKDVNVINFVLDEFEDYFYENEIFFTEIDNNYIINYIKSIPKASVATMMHRRAILHKFLKYIVDETQTNCFEKVFKNMKVYKKQKGIIQKSKIIDKEIIEKLLKFINDYTSDPKIFQKRVTKDSTYIAYRNTAIVLLMMGAGCRISEALSLRYRDIEENENSYKINIIAGKGNKNRTTYIQKSLFQTHYNYLKSRKKNDSDFISLSLNNKKVDRRTIYNEVKKMFKFIGEDKQGLHIFRHHFGSEFAEKDGNMKILQDILGHSVITTTMIYSTVGEKAKEDAIIR